jgi:cell division protein ZapA (FtsZ GTPase activity inhibitor)
MSLMHDLQREKANVKFIRNQQEEFRQHFNEYKQQEVLKAEAQQKTASENVVSCTIF